MMKIVLDLFARLFLRKCSYLSPKRCLFVRFHVGVYENTNVFFRHFLEITRILFRQCGLQPLGKPLNYINSEDGYLFTLFLNLKVLSCVVSRDAFNYVVIYFMVDVDSFLMHANTFLETPINIVLRRLVFILVNQEKCDQKSSQCPSSNIITMQTACYSVYYLFVAERLLKIREAIERYCI
ncbi:Hypothetical_protein [Hexamita inflata]|uniref:Hypothetical_protein n=1 Tax=Hexamita inflata TaxID=28002 RepID=A0ABP1JG63_9EUKA